MCWRASRTSRRIYTKLYSSAPTVELCRTRKDDRDEGQREEEDRGKISPVNYQEETKLTSDLEYSHKYENALIFSAVRGWSSRTFENLFERLMRSDYSLFCGELSIKVGTSQTFSSASSSVLHISTNF